MATTYEKSGVAKARRLRGLVAGALVVLAAGPLLAGCGKSAVGTENTSARSKVEARIKESASRNHVPLNELSCLVVTQTKLTCLAHVKTSGAEEATATITASFDNQSHKYKLEGPAQFVGS